MKHIMEYKSLYEFQSSFRARHFVSQRSVVISRLYALLDVIAERDVQQSIHHVQVPVAVEGHHRVDTGGMFRVYPLW